VTRFLVLLALLLVGLPALARSQYASPTYNNLHVMGSSNLTGPITAGASTGTSIPFTIPSGSTPTSPQNGAFWNSGGTVFVRTGGVSTPIGGGGSGCAVTGTTSGLLVYNNGSGGCGSDTLASVLNGALQLGASGTVGSITLGNGTSGLLKLQPQAGALGTPTVLIPAASDTLVNLTSTQTLTNKTLTSPIFTAPVLGTPASGVGTNITGIPWANVITTPTTLAGYGITSPLPAAQGGTGINNGSNTITVPAPGTAALVGFANTFTPLQTFGPWLGAVNNQSGAYTFQAGTTSASDCGKTINETSATAVNVTTIATMPIGCHVYVFQAGAGQVSIVNGSGATQSSAYGYNGTYAQYALVDLYVNANVGGSAANYVIRGDGSPGGSGATALNCVASSPTSGLLITGSSLSIQCTFSAPVTVSGTPQLVLNDSPNSFVNYASGSGTATLTFTETVPSAHNTPVGGVQTYLGTNSTGVFLNGGTITAGGANAVLTGANNQIFTGLAENTGTVFYASTGGSGSTCSSGAPCSISGLLTKLESNAPATGYLQAGTYTPGSAIAIESSAGGNNIGFSNYPGATVILNGSSSVAKAFTIGASSSGSGNTINGMTIENYTQTGVDAQAFSGLTVSNLTMTGITSASTNQGCVYLHYQMGGINLIANNSCSTNTGPGYVVSIATGDPGWSGCSSPGACAMTWTNSKFNSVDTSLTDSGALYWDDQKAGCNGSSVNCYMTNNAVVNWGHSTSDATKCIYLDDNTSGINISGNSCAGTGQYAFQIHGGANNVFTNNAFDISGAQKLGYYQDSSLETGGMVGNAVTHSIIYSTAASPSYLWDVTTGSHSGTPASPTVGPNQYYDSSGGPGFTHYGDSTGLVTDSSPNVGNPLFVSPGSPSYNYQLGGASPALGAPVNFTQLPQLANIGPH
jgi:hypothetical protein